MRAGPVLTLVVLIGLLGLLLAGCSGPDPQAAMPPESASASSSTAPAPDAGAAAAAPQRAVEAVPFTWSGHTKEGAWACMEQSGVGQCPAGQQVQPDGEYVGHAAYPGNLTAVDLAMTWQADPTQTGLVLAVYGNTTSGRTLLAWAQGDSPLRLSLDAAGLGLVPDGALMLMVWPEGKTATSPSVFVDATQQAFTVDGTLSVRR